MNESPSVSDDEGENDFDDNYIIFDAIIDEAENTKTQFNAEEAVEDEEFNNNNGVFEYGNKRNYNEDDTQYLRRSARLIHRPNNLIPNIPGVHVQYEGDTVNLQVEDMSKIDIRLKIRTHLKK